MRTSMQPTSDAKSVLIHNKLKGIMDICNVFQTASAISPTTSDLSCQFHNTSSFVGRILRLTHVALHFAIGRVREPGKGSTLR